MTICCALLRTQYCAEILLTEVVPAFEKIPTLIGTEGIVAGKAHVFSPMREFDGTRLRSSACEMWAAAIF